MMKKLFFILTIFLFSSQTTLAADCSSIKVNPVIKINASYGKLSYDETKPVSEITSTASKFNLVETGLFASGLSTVNITFDITINTLGNLIGNSEICVTPTEVNIFLGLENPTIYLAKELEKDSCEYKLVQRHEKIHQQINKTTLEYYLPMFKQIAEIVIKTIPPVYITDIDNVKQASAELTTTYNQKLTPLVDYIKKEMLSEQQKLDNPKNYQFESTLCL